MYLHYDFETEGLNVEGQPSDHPDQPGPISLTAILDDPEGNTLEIYNTLIKPNKGVQPEAFAIHGISTERAEAEGVPVAEAIRIFATLAAGAKILSAFNHFFDFKMAKVGCARMGDEGERIRQLLETKTSICTMDSARKFLGAGRYIKLMVAHERLLGVKFDKAHESMADTQAHRQIFYHLKRLNGLHEPKPLTRKIYSSPPPPRDAKPAEASIEPLVPRRPRPLTE